MIRCECCGTAVPEPVIRTRLGSFVASWSLCRGCWRLVGRDRRRTFCRAWLEYRALPFLEQALLLYRAWLAVAQHAAERHRSRRAA